MQHKGKKTRSAFKAQTESFLSGGLNSAEISMIPFRPLKWFNLSEERPQMSLLLYHPDYSGCCLIVHHAFPSDEKKFHDAQKSGFRFANGFINGQDTFWSYRNKGLMENVGRNLESKLIEEVCAPSGIPCDLLRPLLKHQLQ